MPLLEFVVDGPPVSQQTRDRKNLQAWRTVISAEATKTWGAKPLLTGRLRCMIINFFEGKLPPLDDDNMVKPIRDAMNNLIYADDEQIRYSETIQVSIDDPIRIRRGSIVLLTAFSKGDEFVYIRLDDAPDIIQLPQ
jgi:crossover junction endodeoxyribonuclease RusA